MITAVRPARAVAWRLPGPAWALALAAAALWLPTIIDLYTTVWRVDPYSQGPLALAMAIGLVWHQWRQPHARAALATARPHPALGLAWLLPGLALQVIGRSQGVLAFEVVAAAVCAVGIVTLLGGPALARALWFCFVFLLFSVPLPGVLVDALT